MGTKQDTSLLEQMLKQGEEVVSLYQRGVEKTKNYGLSLAGTTVQLGAGTLVGVIRMYGQMKKRY